MLNLNLLYGPVIILELKDTVSRQFTDYFPVPYSTQDLMTSVAMQVQGFSCTEASTIITDCNSCG